MLTALAGGVLLGGCSPVAVDIAMSFISGVSSSMNAGGAFEALIRSMASGV